MSRRYLGSFVTYNPVEPTTSAASGMWPMNQQLQEVAAGTWPLTFGDPYFNYTSLLLSTTSLSNANSNLFVDSSGAFNPISRNGNTTQGSATPYGANWSNYFDGTGDYLTLPSGAAFQFGTGDFTVECWVYSSNAASTSYNIVDARNSGQTGTWVLFRNSNNQIEWYNGSSSYLTSTNIPANQWNHVAYSRSGTTGRVLLNGAVVGTFTDATNYSVSPTTSYIGCRYSVDSFFNGYISNLRTVKGTALYTGSYTVPTTPLTAISGTSLLTCQSNRFRDASTNNFTITRNGDTRTTNFAPFLHTAPIQYDQSDITNWSGYFDGTGDYLSMPSNAAFAFGTGDYTIEGWIYTTVSGTDKRITWFSDDRHNIDINTSNQIFLYDGSIRTFGTIVLGAWNHFAVSRTSGTVSCYLNGVRGYNASETTNSTTRSMNIASNNAGNAPFNGYISNIRVVKGTGVYSGATITVPTTNLTAISGTSLLTLQNAAFTDNSTNNFILTQNGNPTVTGNSPFNTVGYWSNYFDGSGDFLSAPSNAAFDLGSSDFTVECWFNANSFAAGFGLISRYNFTSVGLGWLITIQNSTTVRFVRGNDIVLDCTVSAMSTGVWYHVAAVRNGSTLTVYLNGVQVGQATGISNFTDAATALQIGRTNTVTNDINGYISNARVVKGTAVYTAAFTPPTTPLTAITNTSLLTCQNGRFIDNSTNAFAITVNGNTSVQSFDPFYTSTIASNGGSMYFDGSGDFITSVSPSFAFGTGAWTVEFWVYPLAYGGSVCGGQLFGTVNGAQSGYSINLGQDINNFRIISNATGTWADNLSAGAGNGPPLNAWSHMVVVRSGANLSIYRNGTRVATTASASSWNFSGTTATIGRFNEGSNLRDFNGYLSNMRVTGAAVYDPTQSTLTVPTAPVNPIPNTVIMPNGMNAGAYDATAINDMETVGNAQVSTAVSKFGGSSMYFDGAGDRILAAPSEVMNLATGDFTVEGWFYSTTLSGTGSAVTRASSGNISTGAELQWGIYRSGSSLIVRPYQSTTDFSINVGTIAANTWYHVAITRSGNTVRGFLNGVVAGTTQTVSGALNNNTAWYGAIIGGITVTSVDEYWNGYIDDLRITKGYARYTANFTPPTAALPTY